MRLSDFGVIDLASRSIDDTSSKQCLLMVETEVVESHEDVYPGTTKVR